VSSPKVSVIVVSYNRSSDLRACLSAIFASRFSDLEVLVVDNASSDDAVAVARSFPGLTVLENRENLGFAAANNQALELARGEYVALVNNDAVIAPDWLSELVAFLDAEPKAAAAGGRLYHWNDESPLGDTQNHFFGYSELRPDGSTPAVIDPADDLRETAFISGAAALVRRRAIDEVGPPFLDPTYFMYYEETDFFARAIRRGFRVYFLARAAAWHRVRGGVTVAPYRYHFYMHRNRLLFGYRHFDDEALEALLATARRRATNARVRSFLRIGFRKADALRARRDAWDWAEQHRSLLLGERERFRNYGVELAPALRAIERRARGEAGE